MQPIEEIIVPTQAGSDMLSKNIFIKTDPLRVHEAVYLMLHMYGDQIWTIKDVWDTWQRLVEYCNTPKAHNGLSFGGNIISPQKFLGYWHRSTANETTFRSAVYNLREKKVIRSITRGEYRLSHKLYQTQGDLE